MTPELAALRSEIARLAALVLALEHYRKLGRRCVTDRPCDGEVHLWRQERRLLQLLDQEQELLDKQPTCKERKHEPSTD